MLIETLPIAELQSPAKNVRTHPELQVAELARAIEMFGQTRPCVIDENNVVLAGNGLVAALRRLGREDVSVFRVNGLSEDAKKKLMLSDNRIHQLGLDDNNAIFEMLSSLDDFEIPGFDPDVLKSLVFDAGEVTADALDTFGKLSDEAIANVQQRNIPSPTPGANGAPLLGDNEEGDERLRPRSLTCPNCGHVVPLDRMRARHRQ